MKNPRAFPRPIGNNGVNEYNESQRGMSLRDYFAGQAMAALIVADFNMSEPRVSELAYKQADAMLEEREMLAKREKR